MPLGVRLVDQGSAACEQRQPALVREPLYPGAVADEVVRHFVDALGAPRGLDHVGDPEHHEEVRLRAHGVDGGEQPVERLGRATEAEIDREPPAFLG
jgi:hypothetical protein